MNGSGGDSRGRGGGCDEAGDGGAGGFEHVVGAHYIPLASNRALTIRSDSANSVFSGSGNCGGNSGRKQWFSP